MTPEQQQIAIAEACGWTYKPDVNFWERIGQLLHGDKGQPTYLPNYLNDLNAMHEAENTVIKPQGLWYQYCLRLEGRSFEESIGTTASQRAEAFLRTIGKWQEVNP
jgi:hypothetical protein